MKAKILLVDDHAIIRRGLKFIVDSNFANCKIDEAEDGKSLMQKLKQHWYTHLILDLQLQDCNTINLFIEIRNHYPNLPILIYTMSPEDIFGKRLLNMGAMGFLSKQASEEELIKALNLFLFGRKYLSPAMQVLMKNRVAVSKVSINPFDDLSERELTVVHNLLKGKGVKEIAFELDLKSTTVATFKGRIFDKIGVSNVMDLRNIAELYNFGKQ